jgi:hypothetical protein
VEFGDGETAAAADSQQIETFRARLFEQLWEFANDQPPRWHLVISRTIETRWLSGERTIAASARAQMEPKATT